MTILTYASRAETAANDRPEIEAQIDMVKGELERLSNALLGADEKPETVLRMIAEREKRLVELNVQLANARTLPLASITDSAKIAAIARKRLNDLLGLFSRHIEAAHRVMEALLGGPLTFTAKEKRTTSRGKLGRDGWIWLKTRRRRITRNPAKPFSFVPALAVPDQPQYCGPHETAAFAMCTLRPALDGRASNGVNGGQYRLRSGPNRKRKPAKLFLLLSYPLTRVLG